MKITDTSTPLSPFDLDVKRFHLPAILEGTCPKCSAPFVKDFSDEYLSYPKVGKPFEHGCYCSACDHEWKVTLKLNLTLELA